MALPQSHQPMTEAEYLEFERDSEVKHEFVDGEIYAMAGASWNHIVIVSNINTRLNVELEKSACIAVTNDMKVYVISEKSFRYPDVVVVCGDPIFREGDNDILTNPTAIFEVISPSTAVIDRNDKLDEYFKIPTLQEYLIVWQDEVRVDRFLRSAERNELRLTKYTNLDTSIELSSLALTLKLSQIYNQVKFKSDQ